ncbi:MAG: amidophosphoribosyltransferase [Spirochaetes bacterium]|nr:amidophosphoribosyltransferase [Spirochaetota bacterium]
MLDELKEECGVFGMSLVQPNEEIINNMYLGIFALQHRGQESCGIAYQNESIEVIKHSGLVAGKFFENLPRDVKASQAIGHVRYSTCGPSNLINAQPLVFSCNKGEIAVAHNGNIPNSEMLKSDLIQTGSIFQTSSDSEILVHLISRIPGKNFETSLVSALNQINGAYSMLLLHNNQLIALRDPYGFRPLCYGEIKGGIVFASETNALDIIGAKNIKEVEPGEIIFCHNGKIEKKHNMGSSKKAQCIFELIYFSRPDSKVFGETVHDFRLKIGACLAKKCQLKPDIVIPVPDSGNSAAMGFAREAAIPFDFGLIRNHYTGRTFIKPGQQKRVEGVRLKLNPVKTVINGKSIAVIDDSLVRGTTSSKIVEILKDAGAKEVHLFLSSPEIKYSCFFGIDTPTRKELISSKLKPEEIAAQIGADSVTFLTIEDLKISVENPGDYCYACFNCDYPFAINED